MDIQKRFKTSDENDLDTNKQGNVNICELLNTLAKPQHKWDKILGRNDIARHRVELTLQDVHPIYCAYSRSETKAREFLKTFTIYLT